MIQRIINNKVLNGKPTKTIAGAALIVSVASVLSRILGLFRDRILASKFGAGDTLDVYYAAFRVPDLIYNFLIVGALSAAFIPVFTGLVAKKDEEKAWKLSSGLVTLQVIVIVGISLIFFLFAPELMRIITPGFSEEKIMQVANLTRIMFLSPLFLGVSAVFGGILVSYKRFLVYSIAPIFYNIGIIIGAIFFVEFMGVSGLAWGVVLGAVMHFVLQYLAVKFIGFSYQLRRIKEIIADINIRKVIKLMIPRSMAMGVSQINLLIVTVFASTLASGSLAVFNFANNLQSVPLGIFGISFSVAAFPKLSSLAAKEDMDKFNYVFTRTFKRILFFVLPSSVIIFSLRAEIVRVVLGAGAFDWEDTTATLWVLGLLSISLFAQSTIPLLTRCFYALENTKIPFYAALISESSNILLVILLIKKFQVMGLAIAFSLASIINMIILFLLLNKKFKDINKRKILMPITKILLASIFSALAIYLARHTLANFIQLKTWGEVLVQLIISGGIGVSAFLIVCYWLEVEEFNDFRKSAIDCIFKKSADMEEQG
ncbi:MAG: murein biosynthesis integral membrane protein MurJ [Parcubacteria group bacterium]